MAITKKEKLIKCLKKLQMQELHPLIYSLEKRNLTKEPDLNATLTRIIYNEIFTKYLDQIKANPNNRPLIEFCLNEIGNVKLSSVLNEANSPPSKINLP